MKLNVGTPDRIVRAILGLALLYIGLGPLKGIMGHLWGIVVLLIGLVLLGTSLMSWCPIWAALGINTRKQEEGKENK